MKVTGYVVAGDNKQSIPGANIVPVDAAGNLVFKKATITNMDGEYSIDVEPGQKLRFSYVGYETKTVKQEDADMVTLKPGIELKEVVITAKRIEKKKDNTLIYAAAAGLLLLGVAAANRD